MHSTTAERNGFNMWTHGVQQRPTPGCSVHALESAGLAAGPGSGASANWGFGLKSRAVSGTYGEIAERWGSEVGKGARAAVLIFTQGAGMEWFLEQVGPRSAGLPIAGGAAARAGDARGGVAPGPQGEMLAWFIDEGDWASETLNVHSAEEVPLQFRSEGRRRLVELKEGQGSWEPAGAVFQRLQSRFGVKSADFESVTISDLEGRNLHCSPVGKELACGSDLPADQVLVVRRTDSARVHARLQGFVSDPGCLVFACAGLYGLLGARLQPGKGTLTGFMFGEVVTVGEAQRVVFGNLMASRLRRKG